MSLIIDPTNTADDAGYDGLRVLLGIDAAQVSNADIDADPLFQDAEEFIVGVVPAVALPSGRTYANRTRVIRALQFLAAYNFLFGGSDTITTQTSGGAREVSAVSESIGPITTRTDYRDFGGSTTRNATHGVDNRSTFFLNSAYAILKAINPNFEVPVQHTSTAGGGSLENPTALLTSSKLYG